MLCTNGKKESNGEFLAEKYLPLYFNVNQQPQCGAESLSVAGLANIISGLITELRSNEEDGNSGVNSFRPHSTR